MRALRRTLPWLIAAVVVFLAVSELRHGRLLPEGTAAPDMLLELSDGSVLDLKDVKGKVVVVNFWAPWCPPCRAEAPVLSGAYQKLKKRGGTLVGISTEQGDLQDMAVTAAQLGMRYPVAIAQSQQLATFHVESLPTTYVVAGDGTIVQSFVGAVNEGQLDRAIDKAFEHTKSG